MRRSVFLAFLVCCFSLTLFGCSTKKTPGSMPGTSPEEKECGNDVRIEREQCDGVDLAGHSCTALGYDDGTLACMPDCTFDISECTGTGPSCGNKIAEGLEECDEADLRSLTCRDLGFEGGILACVKCVLDATDCTGEGSVCGDDNAEGLEECDGVDLRQMNCEDFGFNGGILKCDSTCRIVTGDCEGEAQVCGDGEASGLEECDGDDTNGISCVRLGYDSGALGCDETCVFDVSNCVGEPAICGDDIKDGLEECDESDLDGTDCTDLDYIGGDLACDESCTFDPTSCIRPVCGNDLLEPGEECDNANVNGQDCSDLGLGLGDLSCKVDCTLNISACAPPVCGDGVVNQEDEECDNNDFNGETCRNLSFQGGQLLCDEQCHITIFFCWGSTAECGDGERAVSEECEGIDLGGQDCETLGWDGGELACGDNCTFVTSDCTGVGAICSDGVAEGEEICDGEDLRDMTCENFGFTGGSLACTNGCWFTFSGCIFEPVCGNDIVERGEICDGSDVRDQTCEKLDLGTGDLACLETCDDLDFSNCSIVPICGNGVAEGLEVCDGADVRGLDSCLIYGYTVEETVTCLETCGAPDLSLCTGEPSRCGNGRAQGPEQCDGEDFRRISCEELGYSSGTLDCNDNCSYEIAGCAL